MQKKFTKFLKIYLVFLLVALAVNLTLELIVPTPEKAKIVSEYGLNYFLTHHARRIIIFYLGFSAIGALILLYKKYSFLKMGFLSFIIGFIFEFTFMQPDWVQNIYALEISGAVIATVIISALYWFVPWSVPVLIGKKLKFLV